MDDSRRGPVVAIRSGDRRQLELPACCLTRGSEATPDDRITPEEAIKDSFVLEFLDLKDEYSETDLEKALIQRLTDFLLEIGDDFAFVGRQRRLRLDEA
jgi:predicted nuclease of restriction endonuclease-like (RecB) superfamily